jgi:hypothetical protein
MCVTLEIRSVRLVWSKEQNNQTTNVTYHIIGTSIVFFFFKKM